MFNLGLIVAINLQQKGGENLASTFQIERSEKEFYRRFKLEARTLYGTFSTPPENSEIDIYKWYETAFHDLKSKICRDARDEVYIGVTLHSSNFKGICG